MDTPSVEQRMYMCDKCWRIGTDADFPQGFHYPCACGPTKINTYSMTDGHKHYLTVSYWESLSKEEQAELYKYNKKSAEEIKQISDDLHEHQAQRRAFEAEHPHCPSCRSLNIARISNFERALSATAWGLGSGKIGKQYKCKNCGYKW